MKTCLYTGRVSHSRFRPRRHRFDYGICMVLLDLSAGCQVSPRWMRRLFPLRGGDHLKQYRDDSAAPLTSLLAQMVLEKGGIDLDEQGQVFLLTGFGFLWHRFNPASFYFCFGSDGGLQCLVAEVTNTPWQEQSYYVLSAAGLESGQQQSQQQLPELRLSCPKDFHVSPFMPMNTCYHWHVKQEDNKLRINIAVDQDSKPLFNAALDLVENPLSTAALLAALVRQPFMSLSVSMRIYWQALRLWLKSTPLFPHPRYSSGDK